jgi:CBS domain containing-hemolysin-like protein
MRPRMEIVAIENTSNYTEVLQIILHAGYSRIPVYASTFDNIIGILYIKDLLPHLEADETFDWLSLVHKPFFVPENKKLDDLLKEFQSKKMHMSIVVDEYGGASGLATLEDVLEEIVGDITDEYDEKEINFTKISDNNYQFEGRTALVDFYKVLEIDGKEFEANKGESDTLGGFMVEQAGRILRNKEHIEFENFKLIVEKADKKRIKTIRVLLQELNNETTSEN